MPNAHNITKPITMLGIWRSGTSVISKVIEAHPDVFFMGETFNLLMGPWAGAYNTLGTMPVMEASLPKKCGDATRYLFCKIGPSRQDRWMHKPLGTPLKLPLHQMRDNQDFLWMAFEYTFPMAQYFTVLRNPCDVVVSQGERFQWSERERWKIMSAFAGWLLHHRSKVEYAIDYSNFLENPRIVIQDLFEHLELDFREACMKPTEYVHVPNNDQRLEVEQLKGHRDWSKLDPQWLQPKQKRVIQRLYDQFEIPIEWPEGW